MLLLQLSSLRANEGKKDFCGNQTNLHGLNVEKKHWLANYNDYVKAISAIGQKESEGSEGG